MVVNFSNLNEYLKNILVDLLVHMSISIPGSPKKKTVLIYMDVYSHKNQRHIEKYEMYL